MRVFSVSGGETAASLRRAAFVISTVLAAAMPAAAPAASAADAPHNLVIFVPDGLRAGMVDATNTPNMAALRDKGVAFANSHSIFPTFTMANSSAMSTGHYLGDTGVFSNTIYTGYPVAAANGTVTAFIENDAVLGDIDEHFAANFLDEETILRAASAAGFSTAAVGKVGPALIFDHTERTGNKTIVIDDATGSPTGIPLSPEVVAALALAGVPTTTPSRGANGSAGSADKAGTVVANIDQQAYFANAAAKVVLPLFKKRGKPFVVVFWSRDPDGSQHNQGDSLNQLTPGINGPTSLAGIRNADTNLGQIRAALDELGLSASTDIIVTADHGFSTVSKQSATSPSTLGTYAGVPKGFLPPGFLAIDIAHMLGLPLADPEKKMAPVTAGERSTAGNGVIGNDPAKPDVVVAANGGSDLVYLPGGDRAARKALARRIVTFLATQDYTSGLFVADDLGRIPGTLPMSQINLVGAARTPQPSIVVNFRTFDTGCGTPTNCGVEIADTGLQQGQGMHGSFSRADTFSIMIAAGPAFKSGFVDPAPASNADIGRTAAAVLGLNIVAKGKLAGRILSEAMPGHEVPSFTAGVTRSEKDVNGLRTVLRYQRVGDTRYFDAAGYPGRTLGLQ